MSCLACAVVPAAAERLDRSITSRRSAAMRVAAAVVLVAGAVGGSSPSGAQTMVGAELGLTELEKAFWVCDHAATNGHVDSGTAITCGNLTEALKQRKFDGDFKAMLAWWRQHREAKHLALAKGVGRNASLD